MRSEFHFALPAGVAVPQGGELTSRAHAEPSHAYRTPFARDGARILHAKAFRRLAGKTQVFTRLPGEHAGDHFRSRLTHTLEVTQIARTVGLALGLNVELTEALALAHDIGHPPFGHAGEKALDDALRPHGLRFDHNLHALRIVTWFEERYAAFRGLNLTLGVREGIVKHSRDYESTTHPELSAYFLNQRPPLEAQLIDLADEIAYLAADLDDGLDSGILSLEQVRDGVPLFRAFFDAVRAEEPGAALRLVISETLRRILNALVTDLMEETHARVRTAGVSTLEEIRNLPHRLAGLSTRMEAERGIAKSFLYAHLYNSPGMEEVHQHAEDVVNGVFQRLINEPGMLPEDHRVLIGTEGLARTVTDYIAGMTDAFIEQMWSAGQRQRT
ncbi:dNTP triphosphohydrolase [Acidobacteria bacterium AB60]|nr:dNTP triphosphohydrolase [Acidobacteria bacterium AB60]